VCESAFARARCIISLVMRVYVRYAEWEYAHVGER
jgi:hypothetical protein